MFVTQSVVAQVRIELTTPGSSGLRSTTELPGHSVLRSVTRSFEKEKSMAAFFALSARSSFIGTS